MKRVETRKGFTLVELLVVISIIALLLSVLMPSLGKARDMAKGIVCMSNLKNLGSGYMLYMADFNGYIAPMNTLNGRTINAANFPAWASEIGIPLKKAAAQISYRSSIAPLFLGKKVIMADEAAWQDLEVRTYVMKKLACPVTSAKNSDDNSYYHVTYGVNGDVDGHKVTDIKRPVDTVLATDLAGERIRLSSGVPMGIWISSDEWVYDCWERVGLWHGPKTKQQADPKADIMPGPNNKSFNALSIDGHVSRESDPRDLVWRRDGRKERSR